jgi:hypothetical protein
VWVRLFTSSGQACEQRFQAGGERLDAADEVAVGDDAWHGDGESENGGGEGLGDATGDGEVVRIIAKTFENQHQSRGGAEQTEQRGDGDDGVEHADACVEVDCLFSGGDFYGVGDFALRFSAMFEDDRAEAGEGASAFLEIVRDGFLGVDEEAASELQDFPGEGFRDDSVAGEREGLIEDRHHPGDGGETERDHENSAAVEEIPSSAEAAEFVSSEKWGVESGHEWALEIEVKNEFERFLLEILFDGGWHRRDFTIADSVEGESFLDLAGRHFTDELHGADPAAGLDVEPDGEESWGDEIAVADAVALPLELDGAVDDGLVAAER